MDKKPYYEVGRSEIPMQEYGNIFIANLVWIKRGIHKDIATYDLVVRELPERWSFYMFDGLERFLDVILNYSFKDEDINILKEMNLISGQESETFYKNFKFSGDVMSLKDGTVFFPGEPIVRITAPICEANLLTAFMLNAFSYPVRILTKNVRIKTAVKNNIFLSGVMVRLPGFEQGVYSTRSALLLGGPVIAPTAHKMFPEVKPTGKLTVNINHAFIKSFPSEREAYSYVLREILPIANFISVMIDTYDLKKGLDIFIAEIMNADNVDFSKFMICIGSGDLYELSLYVRKKLDEHGLGKVAIQVMSSLDEYKIDSMVRKGAPINCYIAGTEAVNISDNPRLEAVYKMAELVHADGTVDQKAKLTKGKESYPGRKQVFRVYENGKMVKDIIGLEDEKLGEPLLHKFIGQGKLLMKIPSLEEIKKNLEKELETLPEKYKDVNKGIKYPISTSDKLEALLEEVKKKHS